MQKSRKAKQRKGIDTAKAQGKHMGRKPLFNPEDYIEIYQKVTNGEIDREKAMELIGAGETTFFNMQRKLREKGLI